MSTENTQPIGVFDSGLGGLSVLKELAQRFPGESFVYLGDTARLPYGSKSVDTIYKYAEQNIEFLLEQNCKVIVAACNSASSALLSHSEKKFGVPIINVIEPASQSAITTSQTNTIGVLGTRATVQQKAYDQIITKLNPKAIVHSQACPLFVPFIEEGLVDDPLMNLVIHRYVYPLLSTNIDTLILGCTHYPLIKEHIQKVVGKYIQLIDSAPAVADILQHKFGAKRIEANTSTDPQNISLFITDINSRFEEVASKFLNPVTYSNITATHL